MKRIIVTENTFLVKNLFYIIKEKRNNYSIVINSERYPIKEYTLENMNDKEVNTINKISFIRLFTTKVNSPISDEIYGQSIRMYIDKDVGETKYQIYVFERPLLDDIILTRYSVEKLYKFLKKTKIKKCEIKNR